MDSTPAYNQHTIQGKLNTSSELQELDLAENCFNTVSYICLATVHFAQRHWTKCWVLMFLHEHNSLVQVLLGLSSFSYITAVSIITKTPCRDSKYEHEEGSRIMFKNYLLGM